MEFKTGSRGGVKLCHDGFMYSKKAEKATEFAGSVRSDDLHVTVPHCHAADADAVKAEKVKLKMQTHIRYIRARPRQVLAVEIASAADEVRV